MVGSILATASMALRPFLRPFFLESGSAAASSRAWYRASLKAAFLSRSFSHRILSSSGNSAPLLRFFDSTTIMSTTTEKKKKEYRIEWNEKTDFYD